MADPRAQGWEPLEYVDDFTTLVGPLWARGSGAQCEYGFVVERKHISRFSRLHGAMVMWLADKAMSMAAWEAAGQPEQFATLQLDTQFIRVVQEGAFVHAQCEVVRRTRSIVFVKATLLSDGEPVASTTGIWKFR
ncbi:MULTISPECIES: PaaI family thioesterase [Ramlibacter]|uniref:Medium/long-chain acyl-CoA thioesterase YigI n=1 Tax=Ramlibacter pinisoli TaxID=2682844 RepID=A0A6N8J0G6_9BURK|nr:MULTISPECIES: PaaI family thioesterase [Ramlibacter]MBA2962370.1 PaaI family thioesterase [Ramlibacter sp. CGMCC 1.13660]MVQ32312.1 hotdog fold thioesterase [Ramlibacter pinisoli]